VPYRKLHRLVDERRPELITPPDWLLGEPRPRCGSPDILAATKVDHPGREVITTAISISLIALLAVAVWALYKFAALKLWHGLVCMLFGFYLASSSVAPEIRTTVTSIIHALTGQG
jgi:hypothetical protein